MRCYLVAAIALCLSLVQGDRSSSAAKLQERYTCTVLANGDGSDDTQNILAAFKECNKSGRNIVFSSGTTYYVNSVMNTTGLNNVTIDIYGKLLWSKNTTYWLDHSMPVGYQNQSTVWFLGGDGLTVNGHGTGTIDGNGQTWYDLVKGQSNYPRRPMGLTIWGAKNSVFTGLKFVQSQMWTMAILHSENLLLDNIQVSSITSNGNPARNTDGADLLFSNNVTFRGWNVNNGDDSISLKANSTNVIIENCYFQRGLGVAFGSIGQYVGQYETIQNVIVRNITSNNTLHTGYVKTWTGDQVGYPPNGGGGGLGFMKNITVDGWKATYLRDAAVSITQCTTFSGTTGNCDSSLFQVKDITVRNIVGTSESSYVAKLDCSKASGGCTGIDIDHVSLTNTTSGNAVTAYKCSDVVGPVGFSC